MPALADASTDVPWNVVEAQASGSPAVRERLDAAGWSCPQVLELPEAARVLALCRGKAPPVDAELSLVLLDGRDGASPRVFSRLADASRARMRLYTPQKACGALPGTPCLGAVVLVDQRDESSCYGTQVIVAVGKAPLRTLGFINEVRSEREEQSCVGPIATVSGSGETLRIDLPGPLARSSRDGRLRPVVASRVTYVIRAARPALQRTVVTP